jgi:hypothetical protein
LFSGREGDYTKGRNTASQSACFENARGTWRAYTLYIDFYGWERWVYPLLIGLSIALGVFYLARQWMNRRARRQWPLPLPSRYLGGGNEASQDPFMGGAFGEKRSALRRQGNPIPIHISDATVTAEPWYGWVLDRSMGGLCLSVDSAVKIGTVLSVRPTHAPDTVPWIQIEVRRCREDGKTWELGCQFLKTPSWGILLLFG